jgi:hypothetical protein
MDRRHSREGGNPEEVTNLFAGRLVVIPAKAGIQMASVVAITDQVGHSRESGNPEEVTNLFCRTDRVIPAKAGIQRRSPTSLPDGSRHSRESGNPEEVTNLFVGRIVVIPAKAGIQRRSPTSFAGRIASFPRRRESRGGHQPLCRMDRRHSREGGNPERPAGRK